jgi:hypothetical protein
MAAFVFKANALGLTLRQRSGQINDLKLLYDPKKED